MHDYKTEFMEERHEEELRPFIASRLGISERLLGEHPYERDGWTLKWLGNGAPDGVTSRQGLTEIEPPAE